MEGPQEVISMRPYVKDIIYVPEPHLEFAGGGGGGGISRSSMKIFATIDESGESFAASYTCSKKIHQTESKWTLGTVPQGGKVP